MEYSLATIRLNGQPTAVVESQGRYWSLSQLVPDLLPTTDTCGWMALMDNRPDTEQVLFDRLPALLAANPPLPELDSIDALMAPLLFPGKVCCTGANYRQHLNEVGLSSSFDKHKVRPSFFLKPPRTTVVGSGCCVRYPQQSSQFD
jgi:2-keto-4-pentenoate hydratase/2-oxohepta-3-ene-1,7-dioic acid hydratase in catechol pathway